MIGKKTSWDVIYERRLKEKFLKKAFLFPMGKNSLRLSELSDKKPGSINVSGPQSFL